MLMKGQNESNLQELVENLDRINQRMQEVSYSRDNGDRAVGLLIETMLRLGAFIDEDVSRHVERINMAYSKGDWTVS